VLGPLAVAGDDGVEIELTALKERRLLLHLASRRTPKWGDGHPNWGFPRCASGSKPDRITSRCRAMAGIAQTTGTRETGKDETR
jgi:hypothetical protein